MKSIGGYFNLELSDRGKTLHSDGIFLNTGRNSLEYVLRSLGIVRRVYLPYFTCEVILEPLHKLQIEYAFYAINNKLEIAEEFILSEDEYLIYTNYFGIKDGYVELLSVIYGKHLIIDNAQAFFAEPFTGINTIYSPRKFFGLPDGGIAFANGFYEVEELDISYDRCSHLLKRYDLGAIGGYEDFHINSGKLKESPIRKMSHLTTALMYSIDYESVKEKRMKNFNILHRALKDRNFLDIPADTDFSCPMIYPYYVDDRELRKKLIDNKIYVATYWPNVLKWCSEDMLEYELANNIIALPIDQRYGSEEMDYIIKLLS